jgi:hypothetical protein
MCNLPLQHHKHFSPEFRVEFFFADPTGADSDGEMMSDSD